MAERKCQHCQQPFSPTRASQRFCCPAHRTAHHRDIHDGGRGMPACVASICRLASGDRCVVLHVKRGYRQRIAEVEIGDTVRLLDGGDDV